MSAKVKAVADRPPFVDEDGGDVAGVGEDGGTERPDPDGNRKERACRR